MGSFVKTLVGMILAQPLTKDPVSSFTTCGPLHTAPVAVADVFLRKDARDERRQPS
jgi:hypothetical protein